ncbi:MAG: DUF2254 family protein [Nocardioides sp.]
MDSRVCSARCRRSTAPTRAPRGGKRVRHRAAAAHWPVRDLRRRRVRGSRGTPPDDQQLLACLHLGRNRTPVQDPTFGIRQLVDVGTQALSPAINQMTTAVLVIDRLHDLLLRIGRQPAPSGMYTDPEGTVRLVEPTTPPSYILDLAFREISQYGASSLHVTRRLAAAYADLSAEGVADWQEPMARLQESLDRRVRTHSPDSSYLDLATDPDRLGLG